MNFSVVIPVYNSSKTLEELYERLKRVLESLSGSWEIIMVDDRSSDNSYEIIRVLRERDKRVKIIRFLRNLGQHSATFCGLKHSKGDCIITIDDDLQHPPEEIPRMLEKLREGYEVVIGKYETKKHSPFRNTGSFFVNFLISILTGKPYNLSITNFKVFSRKAADAVISFKGKYFYLSMVLFLSISPSSAVNLEVSHEKRKEGTSGYTLWKLIKLVSVILIYHSPFSAVCIIFGILFIITAGILIFLFKEYNLSVFLFIFFGIIMAGIGASGKYLEYLSLNYAGAGQFDIDLLDMD